MTTVVYRYGLAAPHAGDDIVQDQIGRAHLFRNRLVEIERQRRAAVRMAEAAHSPDVLAGQIAMRAAETAIVDLLRQAACERQRTGARRAGGELATKIAEARASKRDHRDAWMRARRAAAESPALIVALDEIREAASSAQKSAAADSGVYWGTKALVVDAAAKSFTETAMWGDGGEPQDPRFVARRDAQEAVGVQIMGGLTVASALAGTDTQLRIVAPDARAWSPDALPGRHDRRRLARLGELHLRVDSDGRKPVWAAWRMHMDCPLPEGAVIKNAAVHRRRSGPVGHWSVVLTLDVPGDTYARHAVRHPVQGRAVAIDLGWRSLENDGIRVGTWRDERGRGGAIEVDAATLRLLRLPRVIQSERSSAFDRIVFGLAWWIAWGPVPEWLRERCSHIHQWRSPARIVTLFRDWERHEGDTPMWAQLESFCASDRHAWAQQESLRDRAMARRREIYRTAASRLSQEYDVLVLERFDLSRIAQSEARETGGRDDHQAEGASAARQLAAPSTLREALIGAFRSRGKARTEMPAGDSTRIHATCGVVEDRPVARAIHVTCTGCGQRFDQDQNACEVLLSRYCERLASAQMAGPGRSVEQHNDPADVAETRWARAKRKRADREAKVAGAREALAKSAR